MRGLSATGETVVDKSADGWYILAGGRREYDLQFGSDRLRACAFNHRSSPRRRHGPRTPSRHAGGHLHSLSRNNHDDVRPRRAAPEPERALYPPHHARFDRLSPRRASRRCSIWRERCQPRPDFRRARRTRRLGRRRGSGARGSGRILAANANAVTIALFVRLASLSPQVRFEVDESALALRLIVAPALLGRTVRDVAFDRPSNIEYHRVPSGFVNYGASVTTTGTRALSLEGGVSAAGALLTTSAFADSSGGFLRGQTALTIDDRRRLNRYRRWRRGCHDRRARRQPAACRRERVARLLARPVLRAISVYWAERRGHDTVARRNLRQRSTGSRRAVATGRVPVKPSAAPCRSGQHAGRGSRRVWRTAGIRLFVLHQRGSAGTRSSAILVLGRHGAAAALRIELCVWRSGPPWTSSGRSHRQHHDGWSHRNGPRHAEWRTGCDGPDRPPWRG